LLKLCNFIYFDILFGANPKEAVYRIVNVAKNARTTTKL